ncbi:MAG: U32 family peptidase [Acholeplasmatales bacterium]|nr:U32 family peptidase [Acholeplasmatales bacterium]
MKLVTSVYTMDEIEYLKDSIDYALVAVPHMAVNYKDIDIDKAIALLKSLNKGIILNINRIMHPSDLSSVEAIMTKYKDLDLMFYVSDLGAVAIARKLGIVNKVIYNPETMITNYLDLNEYYSLGVNACGLSSEITLKDVKLMNEKDNAKIFYQVFGRRLMFYSRRHLVSLYETKNEDKYPRGDLYLREATRKDFLPIIENDECTTIYRSYSISLLDKLDELSFIEYAYLESLYQDMDKFKKVNECFYNVIVKNESKEEAIKVFNSLEIETEEGFFNKDSVYQKEELKNV